MMYWYGNGMGGWVYALMTVNMLLLCVLLVGGIAVAVRYLAWSARAHPGAASGSHTPEQVLVQRFARGEIDEEEYRRRVAIVRGSPTP